MIICKDQTLLLYYTFSQVRHIYTGLFSLLVSGENRMPIVPSLRKSLSPSRDATTPVQTLQ